MQLLSSHDKGQRMVINHSSMHHALSDDKDRAWLYIP